MPDELWIVDLGGCFDNSLVRSIEKCACVEVVVISGKDVEALLDRSFKFRGLGNTPILLLLDSRLPNRIIDKLMKWRLNLEYHDHNRFNFPMIDFFVVSPETTSEARKRWSNTIQRFPDDYHFYTIEHLKVGTVALVNRARVRKLHAEFGMIMSPNSPLLEIKLVIDILAHRETTVLINGDSGTGKELVAKAIHLRGPRSKGPLVSVNCAGIPEGLLEAELFGTVRGAATGAVNRKGYIEQADKGTLFLDEIGNLSLAGQAKLLRVLQEREVQRLGSTRTIRVDIRLIAVTNKDLEAGIREGWFREDLFFRIGVYPIYLPPLRERGKDDILFLIQYFLIEQAQKYGQGKKEINDKAIEALLQYSWPGNVRELSNVIERAIISCEHNGRDEIKLEDLLLKPSKIFGTKSHGVKSVIDISHNKLRETLNPNSKVRLSCDDIEQIKLAIDSCRGMLLCAEKLFKQAGFKKDVSRGRLRNLLGLSETKDAMCPELRDWYLQKYRNIEPSE